jgi:hypothetical protein
MAVVVHDRAKLLILLYSDAHGGVAQMVRAWDS